MDVALIRTQNHGDIKFDYTMQMDHAINFVTTSHPVQIGAEVSDHAYREPDEVTLQVAYSDTVKGSVDGHSVQAFGTLETIANERQLVTLVTRLKSYSDMLITSISVPDNYETMYGLRATIIFKKIELVDVETMQVQATVSSSKSPSANTAGAAPSPSTSKSSGSSSGSGNNNSSDSKRVASSKVVAIGFSDKKSAVDFKMNNPNTDIKVEIVTKATVKPQANAAGGAAKALMLTR